MVRFSRIAATLLLSLVSVAASANSDLVGTYVQNDKTFLVGYEATDCQDDGGSWDGSQKFCLFDVENSVKIETGKKSGKLNLQIETVGGNGHTCFFENEASVVGTDKVQSSVLVDDYSSTETSAKVLCEVTVTSADKHTVSVSTNGKCQAFCGMRAVLDIEKAVR